MKKDNYVKCRNGPKIPRNAQCRMPKKVPSLKFTASPAVTGSGAERDAIEALLSMGSMPRA